MIIRVELHMANEFDFCLLQALTISPSPVRTDDGRPAIAIATGTVTTAPTVTSATATVTAAGCAVREGKVSGSLHNPTDNSFVVCARSYQQRAYKIAKVSIMIN